MATGTIVAQESPRSQRSIDLIAKAASHSLPDLSYHQSLYDGLMSASGLLRGTSGRTRQSK